MSAPNLVAAIMRAVARKPGSATQNTGTAVAAADLPSVLRAFDPGLAEAEGWNVFDCGLHPDGSPHVELQRVDWPSDREPVFTADSDAWQHVVERARQGSALHLGALEMVDTVERMLIEASCGW